MLALPSLNGNTYGKLSLTGIAGGTTDEENARSYGRDTHVVTEHVPMQ
jgi:hypothetical protein